MVRKASFNHQNKRADDFKLRDENGKKSEELTCSPIDGLTRLYQFYVRTHAAGVGEPLAQRLVQTMIIRHKRILYRRARRRVWNPELFDYPPRKLENKSHHLSCSPPAQETISPSDVDINMIRQTFAQSEVSKATSNSLLVSDRVLVPPRPAAAKLGVEFICDYCGLLLQARQASSAAVWAKHERKDLDPYVCVFDECDTPLELYSPSKEWLAHMRSQHRMRWHCFATSHEPSFFASPDIFEDHLKEIHSGHFSGDEISFLVENGSHPSLPAPDTIRLEIFALVGGLLYPGRRTALPWSEDCYSSYHPSQSSRSAHSEGTGVNAEASRNDDDILDVRKTDWDAWERDIQGEDKNSKSSISQWCEAPMTGERSDVLGLLDFAFPNYDAAKDELLEPFRRRELLNAVKEASAEKQLSERRVTLMSFMTEEAAFVQDLQALSEVYKGTFKDCVKLDQLAADRIFRNLDQLTALHVEFLEDLKTVLSSELRDTQIPVSNIKADFERQLRSTHVEQKLKGLGIIPSLQSRSRNFPNEGMPLAFRPEKPADRHSRLFSMSGEFEESAGSSETSNVSPQISPSAASKDEDGSGPSNPKNSKLWSTLSLHKFQIGTSNREAGYPYLCYDIGEVFDVIAEKGELWLAIKRDDPDMLVGWIWYKHFDKC
ncbi:hypothetical protein LA080_012285 [Diaporthe eres]|nr:hypothetical protein LA080_012285 [Diaporthe eres]